MIIFQVQHYILSVQAQDKGQPSLSSVVTVYFNVLDLNDNAPIFDPMSYSDEVLENITVGSSVLSVSATDQDSGNFFYIFNLMHFCSYFINISVFKILYIQIKLVFRYVKIQTKLI